MKNSNDTTIAGELEEKAFHDIIDNRIKYFILQVKLRVENPELVSSATEWAIRLKDKLHEVFSNWFRNNIAGSKIPKEPVIPRPRQDRIYRKMAKEFENSICEVCGDDRVLNIAHIIPRADNGPDEKWNLMRLCANHHQLFDQGKLTKEEFYSIDWDGKDDRASGYALGVRLKTHERTWVK